MSTKTIAGFEDSGTEAESNSGGLAPDLARSVLVDVRVTARIIRTTDGKTVPEYEVDSVIDSTIDAIQIVLESH